MYEYLLKDAGWTTAPDYMKEGALNELMSYLVHEIARSEARASSCSSDALRDMAKYERCFLALVTATCLALEDGVDNFGIVPWGRE